VQWNAPSDTAQVLLAAVGIDFGDRWEFGLRRDLFGVRRSSGGIGNHVP
jgi:hypothetical protein